MPKPCVRLVDGISGPWGILNEMSTINDFSVVGGTATGTTGALGLPNAATITNLTIADVNGVSNVFPSVTSQAMITAPISPYASTFYLTGTTSVTSINGFWVGRVIRILYPSGAGITVMGHTLAAGGSLTLCSDGTSATAWY